MRKSIRGAANGDAKQYLIQKDGQQKKAIVLEHRGDEVYVHYAYTDKRNDEWRLASELKEITTNTNINTNGTGNESDSANQPKRQSRKRKRGTPLSMSGSRENSKATRVEESMPPELLERERTGSVQIIEDDIDLGESRKKTEKRNFDKVNFGQWQIKTWYYSPYPLLSSDEENIAVASVSEKLLNTKLRGAGRGRGSTRGRGIRGRGTRGRGSRGRGSMSDISHDGFMHGSITKEKPTLWICDRCFKYMREGSLMELHSKTCHSTHPPGRKVYQRGGHIIWEVDGAKQKLFCQNLALFGKLFIDIKTLFFDTENFVFYLLTEGDSQRDHVLGFFSKEKISYDGNNLACIITFPPYQRRRYGMLMIEFSYELSRRTGEIGTPERPLSELGLRSFLTYWTASLIQFFRRMLSVRLDVDINSDVVGPIDDALVMFLGSEQQNGQGRHKRRKSNAWEAGAETVYHNRDVLAATSGGNDKVFQSMRRLRTTANPDGSATTHVFVKCTLKDISIATNIRIEDVAFTLHECGMLQRRRSIANQDSSLEEEMIVISREIVEQVAKERGVKKMCMEVEHVLL